MTTPAPVELDEPPALARDRSFWGMTATQFLGAFNDNLFKQLVLLICVEQVAAVGRDYQPIAQGLFAIPFVLFSGFAGYLADRTSKRTIVVLAKVAEVAIMLLGMAAFWAGAVDPERRFLYLFLVLFLMSTQSAYFGPSKYGILPEMFRERDLPRVNGMIQMTTFVAIIFGMASAGYAKEWFGERLWVISGMCVGIAVAGTATSLWVRKTPIAHPGLKFRLSSLAINAETWRLLRSDRPLLGVLLIASLFWFVGGVVQQGVNSFGKVQLGVGDARTSLMAACLGVGIAVGCIVAGKASHERVNFRLVTTGAWGIVLCLAGIAGLGLLAFPEGTGNPTTQGYVPPEVGTVEWLVRGTLTLAGFSAGLFVVPLQVFLQTRPPKDQKGRMIGAMNLVNWIGILLSAAFFTLCTMLFRQGTVPDHPDLGLPISWTFALLAAAMLPVALFYRPGDAELDEER